ncbi:hypothetical protein HPP92_004118 [Vanilla planifolia]|uniref:E3 ubiquitin-protein ligase CHIP n=1 Tax=Vanilla planifolia TaxID=51239 RepID=A0A835SD82_VANPL|nr:hypothetical protein HPP92_004118 [Vanilla planifolia]
MAPVPASVAKQAELLKLDGNNAFKKERLGAAIDAYTEFVRVWSRVEEDCRRAIELDKSSVKAHYMLGVALLEMEDYSEGTKELEKNITTNIMVLEECLHDRDVCEKALLEHHFLEAPHSVVGSEEALKENGDQIELLKEVFNKAAEDDTPTEVPDYLCCKITLDIFRDPVITPSGITYERSVLLDHLQKVGKFDPITREPLSKLQLIPNLAIKEAVRSYLKKHGWAYRMS